MKYFPMLLILLAIAFFDDAMCMESYILKSPDAKISINFWLTPKGQPVYSVSHSGSTILKESKLGIVRNDEDFSTLLTLDSVSNVNVVNDNYKLLHGKRLNCNYTGNKQIFYLKNVNSKIIEIIFQVSNDGVAFRYYFTEKSDTPVRIFKEVTSYHFDSSSKAFLQPCPDAEPDGVSPSLHMRNIIK